MAIDVKAITGENIVDKQEQDMFKLAGLARARRLEKIQREQIDIKERTMHTTTVLASITAMMASIDNYSTDEQIKEVADSIEEIRDDDKFMEGSSSNLFLKANESSLAKKKQIRDKTNTAALDLINTRQKYEDLRKDSLKKKIYNKEGYENLIKELSDDLVDNSNFLNSGQNSRLLELYKNVSGENMAFNRMSQYDKDKSDTDMQWYLKGEKEGAYLSDPMKGLILTARQNILAGDWQQANVDMDKLDTEYTRSPGKPVDIVGGMLKEITAGLNNSFGMVSTIDGASDEFNQAIKNFKSNGSLNVANTDYDYLINVREELLKDLEVMLDAGDSGYKMVKGDQRQNLMVKFLTGKLGDDGNIDIGKISGLDFKWWGKSVGGLEAEHAQVKIMMDTYLDLSRSLVGLDMFRLNEQIVSKDLGSQAVPNDIDLNKLDESLHGISDTTDKDIPSETRPIIDLATLIKKYKVEGSLGQLEQRSAVGSVIMPIDKDLAKSIYGGIKVLRDSSSVLHTLSQPAVLASKPDDWDERYQLSADKLKSTIIDMYSLYRQIDPVEGKSFRKKLRNQLVAHIKDAGKGKRSSFKFDKEIKSILDSIEL